MGRPRNDKHVSAGFGFQVAIYSMFGCVCIEHWFTEGSQEYVLKVRVGRYGAECIQQR